MQGDEGRLRFDAQQACLFGNLNDRLPPGENRDRPIFSVSPMAQNLFQVGIRATWGD